MKPNAKVLAVKEQIIEDPASGLTLMFEAVPQLETDPLQFRLRICGDHLPFGNRDLFFTKDGEPGGSGTATGGICKLSWIQEVMSEEERERRRVERECRVEEVCARMEREDPSIVWGVETGED